MPAPNDTTTPPPAERRGEPDPAFGELLTERGTTWLYWVVVLAFAGLTLLAAAFVVGGVRTRLNAGSPGMASADWLAMVGWGSLFTLVFGGLTYLLVRQIFTKARFYETGARVFVMGKPKRSMPYAECERFWYHTVRQYINGIYAGTTVTITLKAKGMKTVKWSGRHKEKPKGFSFTVLGKGEFKGEDELDVVKLIIADAMADRWINQITAGHPVDWAGRMELALDHATPRKGKRKGQNIAYADIDRYSVKDGHMHLFHKGEEKPFLSIACGDTNFFPGVRVMERMWSVALAPEDGGHTEG